MKKQVLVAFLSVMVLALGISGFLYNSKPKALTTAVTTSQRAIPPTIPELLRLVNDERAKYGVAPLKEDPRLDASAQMKANDEVTYNYFGHVSPHDGKHGYMYINNTGITCLTDGENLTENLQDVNTSAQAVTSWILSPPHHAAMIDPKFTLTGFGIAEHQIVEHFCQQ